MVSQPCSPVFTKHAPQVGMTALPDLKFFLNVPYSEEWREEFKDFFKTLPDATDALFLLNRFARRLVDIQDEKERNQKGIQVGNRLHDLKKKIYSRIHNIPEKEQIDKVGCVVVRHDDKALYTTKDSDETITLGFPKGQYEYKLRNPSDIYTVYGEGYAAGAIRELQEETGFEFEGKINLMGDVYTGVLYRTYEGKKETLPILGGSYKIIDDRFYLVLYVQSTEDLKSNKVPENTEHITGIVWEHQYTKDSPRHYNSFSKQRFEYPGEVYFKVENNSEHLNNINLTDKAEEISSAYFVKHGRRKQKTMKKVKTPGKTQRKKSKTRFKPRGKAHSR